MGKSTAVLTRLSTAQLLVISATISAAIGAGVGLAVYVLGGGVI